jgi:hypothetical protein
MITRILIPWVVIAAATAICMTGAVCAAAANLHAAPAQAVTWFLSAEALAPALLSGVGLTIYFFRNSHQTWRLTK